MLIYNINLDGRLEMVFETIDILAESSKVVELNNFTVILGDTTIYDVRYFYNELI